MLASLGQRTAAVASVVAVCVICLACGQGTTGALLPTEQLEAAFAGDGFAIVGRKEYGGYRGLMGESKEATIFRTGKGKPMLYVEGNATSYGWLTGYLARESVEAMVGPFLERLPLELVAKDYVMKHWNESLFVELEKVVDHLLGSVSVKLFDDAIAAGIIPRSRLEEMEGVVAGASVAAAERGTTSQVSLEKLIAINFGFDVITARVFSGHFLGSALQELARKLGLVQLSDDRFYERLDAVGGSTSSLFVPPAFCDAIGVRGPWTASTGEAYFGRSYQMVTGNTLQDVITLVVYAPDDGGATKPLVSATAPGMVGCLAGMNGDGVAMGVDTIRAPNANPKQPGLNSLLLLRSTLEVAGDLDELVSYVVDARRGAPFLYPACDGSGDCAVLEAGAWLPDGTPEDPLQYVERKLQKAGLVPDAAF
ncbi:uncharacterized protein AMSG_08856 [Thecamonas trahens ATCC 50062]|uniref:Peptidase C45 hydrolase domain-containing protein n=1 Tax=Thecamonas trahens ATCC 50062 TaxID=461836 RepID=A0A0L0DM61_THETB|nr:hypothetical protein AMSG_08856 [Thecamonas trahens ATCC 50062]KNC53355.1 hypothetical protein AMSG_08856 [Thecamonas trahens ATCC 50062]|eukprot:XP_013754401.1 hypothetical protein AMSG_08856 [Thecamonas trahens ATCC 50062]